MIEVLIDDFEFGNLVGSNGHTDPVAYAPIDIARGAITV